MIKNHQTIKLNKAVSGMQRENLRLSSVCKKGLDLFDHQETIRVCLITSKHCIDIIAPRYRTGVTMCIRYSC